MKQIVLMALLGLINGVELSKHHHHTTSLTQVDKFEFDKDKTDEEGR